MAWRGDAFRLYIRVFLNCNDYTGEAVDLELFDFFCSGQIDATLNMERRFLFPDVTSLVDVRVTGKLNSSPAWFNATRQLPIWKILQLCTALSIYLGTGFVDANTILQPQTRQMTSRSESRKSEHVNIQLNSAFTSHPFSNRNRLKLGFGNTLPPPLSLINISLDAALAKKRACYLKHRRRRYLYGRPSTHACEA